MTDDLSVSPISAGLRCRCPRCGEGKLYQSYLKIADRCDHCGLDFGKADAGDGAVPFVIFFIGFVGVALALILMLGFEAPVWVIFAITFPVVIGGTLALMPPAKSILVAMQYARRAGDTGHNTFED